MSVPRVAFFTDSYHEVNGVVLTSREFVRFAKDREYPFFSVHSGSATRHWREREAEAFEIKHSPLALSLEGDLAFDLLFLRHRDHVRRQLRAFHPDLVHVTGPSHAGMLGALIAHDLQVPLVASWHTNLHEFSACRLNRKLGWMPQPVRRPVARIAERQTLAWAIRFYRSARLLFAPNPELVRMLSARTGQPTHLMQRGIDTSLFSPYRRTRSGGEFTIGFVGRLSPEKDVRMLQNLEHSLRDAGIHDYRLLIVGEGSERPWLAQNLKRAVLPGILSGAKLAEAYANMDVFVFPSQTDTFGNVVLEAMASGVPAVVSGCGGPKFLVESSVSGYIAHNQREFAQALMNLHAHPSLRASMAAAARTAALALSWSSVFESVYHRYNEIRPAKIPLAADEHRSTQIKQTQAICFLDRR